MYEGKEVGTMDLSEDIFAIPVNVSLMHEAVKNYLANQRQGTQSTLTRTEVRGGGKKPWRQKGTAARVKVLPALLSGDTEAWLSDLNREVTVIP